MASLPRITVEPGAVAIEACLAGAGIQGRIGVTQKTSKEAFAVPKPVAPYVEVAALAVCTSGLPGPAEEPAGAGAMRTRLAVPGKR